MSSPEQPLGGAALPSAEWLLEPRRVHLIGIGGAGMSAIARVLVALGQRVSGSDMKDSLLLSRLGAIGVRCFVGHRAEQVGGADAVVFSTAIPPGNPELAEARASGIPVWRRREMLGAIAGLKKTLAIAGTHGKTTTTSMAALGLRSAGLDPSFLIGGELNEAGTNAHWGRGDWVVVEADESDGTFLSLTPSAAVITSLEPDHLENWEGSFDQLEKGFCEFAESVDGPLVLGWDDAGVRRLAGLLGSEVVSYGEDPSAEFHLEVESVGTSGTRMAIDRGGAALVSVTLPVPGRHFARNACGAAAACTLLGAGAADLAKALESFGGVERRFQFKGEGRGVKVYDDYAHLPTEVAATIESAREVSSGRVVAVFQPHLYSRTRDFSGDFAEALSGADLVVLTDVFGARERPLPGVTTHLIEDALASGHQAPDVMYVGRRSDVAGQLAPSLVEDDLVITLGAGDVTACGPELVLELRKGERAR